MNQAEKVAAAEQAGRDAYTRGDKNTPWHDTVISGKDGLLNGVKSGDGLPIFEAWHHGWMDENLRAPVPGWTDEENAALQRATGRL